MTNLGLENSYISLPTDFYRFTQSEVMPSLELLKLNNELAELLDLDKDFLLSENGTMFLGGQVLPETTKSISLAYAGHQFGQLVPQLGDGRALLLGDKICKDNQRRDIQLKGSGKTMFSRGGDGRAGIGPVIREYLVSESMHYLDVPTTRSLAILLTGEKVVRETIQPGAILVRVAKSHVRVGTFQFFAIRDQQDHVQRLADFIIDRNFKSIKTKKDKYRLLLENVVEGQAKLIAKWMSVGFIHGVMNTDNTSISCETIDYGPCAFMDSYQEKKVFSSIDQFGRYSFSNQALVGPWNLSRFAETILFLLSDDQDKSIKIAEEILLNFEKIFNSTLNEITSKKLGLPYASAHSEKLYNELLVLMESGQADFTLTLRSLESVIQKSNQNHFVKNFVFPDTEQKVQLNNWLKDWQKLLEREEADKENAIKRLRSNNPIFIPRNHIIEKVIREASEGNFDQFDQLATALKEPFTHNSSFVDFYKAPKKEELVQQTFCGT